jgi:predicted tellurium resistance membrane protein TerC
MEFLTDPNVWIAFATLTLLELVLGIDNVIFISILSDKLPKEQQAKARYVGLSGALVMRILLLLSLTWLIGLQEPLFHIWRRGISGKDLVLLIGGLFLIGKSVMRYTAALRAKRARALARSIQALSASSFRSSCWISYSRSTR